MTSRRQPIPSRGRTAPTQRAGFTLGGGGEDDFDGTFRLLRQNLNEIDRAATRKGSFFNRETMREFDRAMQTSTRQLSKMRDEHRKINLEIRERERRIREIEKMDRRAGRRAGSSVDPGAYSYVGQLRARSMAMQGQISQAGQAIQSTRWRRQEAQEAYMNSPRAAFLQRAGGHHYERYLQLRQNPRLGFAQLAGSAASFIGGGGISGAMMGMGSGMMMGGGPWGKLLGGGLMGLGALFGTSKRLAKLGVKVGGWAVGQIMQGIPVVIENQMGAMGLERTMGVRTGSRQKYLSSVSRYGFRLGYTPAQSWGIAQRSLLASGSASTRDVKSNLAMMRGYSIDEGTLFGAHSAARHFGSAASPEELNKAFTVGISKGGFAKPLLKEFMVSLTQTMGSMEGDLGHTSVKRMGAFMTLLGQSMGGPFSRSPQRVGMLTQTLGRSISNPQGFMQQAETMWALGLGSGKSLDEVKSAGARGGTPENIKALLKYYHQSTGGNVSLMAQYLETRGINYNVGKQLAQAYNQRGENLSEDRIKSLQGQAVTPFAAAAQASKRTGMWQTMEGLRQARGAAALKHQGNIKDVMSAYIWALNGSTDLLKQFTDALRGAITELTGKPPKPRPPAIEALPQSNAPLPTKTTLAGTPDLEPAKQILRGGRTPTTVSNHASKGWGGKP